jgi:hypothetical protein
MYHNTKVCVTIRLREVAYYSRISMKSIQLYFVFVLRRTNPRDHARPEKQIIILTLSFEQKKLIQ